MSFNNANKGLATPASLSILLFSFTILTVATYHFSIRSINTKSGRLNFEAAKQDMLMLENSIGSVLWSPSSSVILSFEGYGGKFETKPDVRRVLINFSYGSSYDIIFNATTGYIKYEMPLVDLNEAGYFFSGDKRTIVNQSFAKMAQLYMTNGEDKQEIHLGYRPLAISFVETSENNTVNVLRMFIVNLNSSESLVYQGSFHIKVRCVDVTVETRNYNFSQVGSSAVIKAFIDDDEGEVHLPVSSNGSFTLVRTEILICDIRVEEVNR